MPCLNRWDKSIDYDSRMNENETFGENAENRKMSLVTLGRRE